MTLEIVKIDSWNRLNLVAATHQRTHQSAANPL